MKLVWKSIWNLNLPNKIQNFAWRACREDLATKSNLLKRHITQDDLCPQCGKGAETSVHLFWFCDQAKEAWSNSKAVFPFSIGCSWSFIDVVWQMVHHKPIQSGFLERVISLCWEIWKNRNTIRNGGKRCSGKTLVRCSTSLMVEFNEANKKEGCLNLASPVRWHPPDPHRFKMNVDGAIFKDQCATGFRMVIRDSQGLVLATMSKRIPATLAVLEAEAKSMETAVHFALEMGFHDVYFKTDSCTLKNIPLGSSVAPTSIETITESILAQVDKFRFVSFTHVKRDGNRPAHILAQFAKQMGDFVVWFEETPNLIEDACS